MSTSTPKLSVVLITYNSEKYLAKVLSSCSFADEIVILDSFSKDSTLEIARKFGAKVFQKEWMGFGRQKGEAVKLASNDWIFSLDSDEVITKELAEEIGEVLKRPRFYAYFVPRLNYFFGKPVRYGGLYPDFTVRLFNRNYAGFSADEVHEKVVVKENKISYLKNHMLHFAYENVEEFVAKQNRYSSLNAKPNKIKAIFNPSWTFFRMFFLKFGFLDGWRGFVIAKLYSQYTFWKYAKKSF